MREMVNRRDTLGEELFLSTISRSCLRVRNESTGNTDIFCSNTPACTIFESI